MDKQSFDKWLHLNAELSVVREEANKHLQISARDDLAEAMLKCYTAIAEVFPNPNGLQEYTTRKAIAVLAKTSSSLMLTYADLLSSHDGELTVSSPNSIIKAGCNEATDNEFIALSELWKEVNT